MPDTLEKMPRKAATALTDAVVRQAVAKPVRYEIGDAVARGLRLAVAPSGSKAFYFRYTFQGVWKRITLGQYPAMSLGQARDAWRDATTQLSKGIDPDVTAKAKRRGVVAEPDTTVTAYVAVFERQHLPTIAPSTATYYKRELTALVDALGPKAVTDVKPSDIRAIIEKAIDRGLSAQVQVYRVMKVFWTWAARRAEIDNPAARIEQPSQEAPRERVLEDSELAIVWRAAEAVGGPVGAAIQMLMLTGARRDEIFYLQHSEMKGDKIVLPGERTKNGASHSIPITWMMRRVLDKLPSDGEYVFRTRSDRGLGGHSAARQAIDTPEIAERWVLHDLRRSFATGLARLGVSLPVVERALNHIGGTSKDRLVRIYQRHDYAAEIVAAFQKWTDHIAGLIGEKRDSIAA